MWGRGNSAIIRKPLIIHGSITRLNTSFATFKRYTHKNGRVIIQIIDKISSEIYKNIKNSVINNEVLIKYLLISLV